MASSLVVIVPVKPLTLAKSRLRVALNDEDREALVTAMLVDTLTAVRAAHLGVILLVSSDDSYREVARRFNAIRVADATLGYNEAVDMALGSTAAVHADAALIVPADLPHASPDDFRRAIEALCDPERGADVVVAAAFDGGTALLGLRPPRAITTAFGTRSAEAHVRAATNADRRVVVLDLPSLTRDIDSVDDLFVTQGSLGEATRAFVVERAALWRGDVAHGRD